MTTTTTTAPTADWLDFGQLSVDPYPLYDRLRGESPVAFVPITNSYWVTSFPAVRSVQDPETFVTVKQTELGERTFGKLPMLALDDPEHAAPRSAVNPGLRPKAMKEYWAPIFERNTRQYLDALAAAGPGAADLKRDFATPLATKNLADLVGLRGAAVPDVTRWSHSLISALANFMDDPAIWDQLDVAKAEMLALISELIPYYQATPDLSFTSALVQAGFPYETVAANVMLAISGGMNEPQHAITTTVWALSAHPEQRAAVLADEQLWPDALDEALRWISPIGLSPRQASRDTEVGGVPLEAGSVVWLVLGAVNRDSAVFPDAAAFDITRAKQPHVAFGGGAHLCAGMWAAKWSLGHYALPMLYRRFEGLRTAEDRDAKWWGFAFRGLEEHPVTWDADRGTEA